MPYLQIQASQVFKQCYSVVFISGNPYMQSIRFRVIPKRAYHRHSGVIEEFSAEH